MKWLGGGSHLSSRLWLAFTLAFLLAGRGVPAATQGARIGTLEVELVLNCSGESSGSHSDATGSLSWSDQYTLSLTTRATYEVLQDGTNAYSGELLDGNSSLNVSGGGTASIQTRDGTYTSDWKYLPASGFDPAQPYVGASYSSEDGNAGAGTTYSPSVVLDPPDVSAITAGLDAAAEACQGVGRSFTFSVPHTLEAWSRSASRTTNVTGTPFLFGKSNGTATCLVQVRFTPETPPQWEAILEPGPPMPLPETPAYDDWLPKGSLQEASEFPGNALGVRVYLQAKNGGPGIPPKARYTFTLTDVSREPGVLMNFPARDAAACDTSPQGPFDLRLYPSESLQVSDDGQHAETRTSEREATAAVASYDFGAFGRLRVVAQTDDGQTLVAHRKGMPDESVLSIPLDTNGNQVADAWEKEMGVFDQNLPPNWDGAAEPAGHAVKGDGISLYEKYRGFLVLNGMGREVYERLHPRKKHLFVRNPDRLVREVFTSAEGVPESYMAAAECEIRYVSATGWTGPGTFRDRRRVVNFNCSEDKHAVDQHALHIVVVTSPHPTTPQDISDLFVSLGLPPKEPLDRGTEGWAFRDPTAPETARKQWRPAANLRTEIYTAATRNYVEDTVLHHTSAACPACDDDALRTNAVAYVQAHPLDAGRKTTIQLSATLTHEMGHGTGVRHHKPNNDSADDNTLKNCTMRYYGPHEFPANPADRFELEARGNNPDSFCRRKHNCWGQIKITDNLSAEAGSSPAEASTPTLLSRPSPLPNTVSPTLPSTPDPEASWFELSADLAWDTLLEGDPLRFSVRLHGLTEGVATPWFEGLQMRLIRLLPDGATEEILRTDAWRPYLLPNAFETTQLSVLNVTRVSEWLVPSDRARLLAGPYRLEIAWNGRTLAPDEGLPTHGIVRLPPIAFSVSPATNTLQQAQRERHLAWERFVADDRLGTLAHVREADRLDPDAQDPVALQTRLMGAACSARLRDAFGAAEFLRSLRSPDGEADDNDHLADFAGRAFAQLAPQMRWVATPAPGGPRMRLQVQAVPGGTYLLQQSTDLMHWSTLSTHHPTTTAFSVDPPVAGGLRFYRILWQR